MNGLNISFFFIHAKMNSSSALPKVKGHPSASDKGVSGSEMRKDGYQLPCWNIITHQIKPLQTAAVLDKPSVTSAGSQEVKGQGSLPAYISPPGYFGRPQWSSCPTPPRSARYEASETHHSSLWQTRLQPEP